MALVAHYKFDEADGATTYADEVSGRDLTHSGTGTRIDGRVGGGGAIHIQSGEELTAADVDFWRTWAQGDLSIAAWVRLEANENSQKGIVAIERIGSGEAAEALVHAYVTNLKERLEWENTTSGTAQVLPGALESALPFGSSAPQWSHVAFTRTGQTVKTYLNGGLRVSGTMGTAQGGTVTNQRFRVGQKRSSVVSSTDTGSTSAWGLDDLRLYDSVLTAEEVLDLAHAQDTTAPTISNVTPTAGGAIGRTEAFAFRVTDDTAFRRILVWATFTDSGGTVRGKEVVYDGSAFAPAYSAGSTRTEVVAGTSYDFSVKRTGGWPHAPSFDVVAIDTSGNEGT